jgi:hypothetical protein
MGIVITVQGTHDNDNWSSQITAALSFFGIEKDKKSTLILQFTDKNKLTPEKFLIGRNIKNESLVQDASVPDISTGMDALMVHSSGFSADIFAQTTRPLVDAESTNIYDIAFCSRKTSFEREIFDRNRKVMQNSETGIFKEVLEAAKKVYDLVYVLIPAKYEALASDIMAFADVNLCCVGQGEAEVYNKVADEDKAKTLKTMFIVADYCNGSVYNSKVLMKEYGVPIIYGLIHNIGFIDACHQGTLISYLNRNISSQPKDEAYALIHNLDNIYNTIVGNKKKKLSAADPDEEMQVKENVYHETEWVPIYEPVITVIKKSKHGTECISQLDTADTAVSDIDKKLDVNPYGNDEEDDQKDTEK